MKVVVMITNTSLNAKIEWQLFEEDQQAEELYNSDCENLIEFSSPIIYLYVNDWSV